MSQSLACVVAAAVVGSAAAAVDWGWCCRCCCWGRCCCAPCRWTGTGGCARSRWAGSRHLKACCPPPPPRPPTGAGGRGSLRRAGACWGARASTPPWRRTCGWGSPRGRAAAGGTWAPGYQTSLTPTNTLHLHPSLPSFHKENNRAMTNVTLKLTIVKQWRADLTHLIISMTSLLL